MPKFIIIDADGEDQNLGDLPFDSHKEAEKELAIILTECDDLVLPLTVQEVTVQEVDYTSEHEAFDRFCKNQK